MTDFEHALPSVSIKVLTPDGTMYVTIVDDESGKPTRVLISIGKAGSRLSAWSDAVGRLVSRMFKKGFSTQDIIAELAGIGSDNLKMQGETEIRSTAEGIAKAFLVYEEYKWRTGELKN
jgi:ribonucleoside-diphosphate reductase alpha chain